MNRILVCVLVIVSSIAISSCNSGNDNNAVKPANVNFKVFGTQQIQTVAGGSRDVTLMVAADKNLNNFNIDNLDHELQVNSDWSLAESFQCEQVSPQKPCVLLLKYSPTTENQSGKLNFDYSYDGDDHLVNNQKTALKSTTSPSAGSATITYSSTTGSNVNANIVPNAQIVELIGLSQNVTISFIPDSSKSATNLTLTTNLSTLSKTNPGWSSSVSSLSCSTVSSSNCSINLTYTPTTSKESGTLVLNYTYYNSSNTLVSASINIPYSPTNWGSNYSSNNVQYITANTVSAQNTSMSGIYPAVESSLSLYLSSASALGYLGPISQLGPLGPLGPLAGSNSWNTSAWIFGGYTWANYYNQISGPLSAAGPLGANGPYTTTSYYNGSLFNSNQFAANTRAFGLWSILGPIGPLGAVGPLGALGPNGATGYTTNGSGAYVNVAESVIRSVSVPYNSTSNRTFDLYENYTQSYATQMPNNDTSFMVVGSLGGNSSNSYTITSSQNQIVSALVVPNYTLGTNIMYVGIYTTSGKLIALSNSNSYINYVMFTATAGTSYIVKVTGYSLNISNAYRLYVTGSYSYLNEYYIQGNYINNTSI